MQIYSRRTIVEQEQVVGEDGEVGTFHREWPAYK